MEQRVVGCQLVNDMDHLSIEVALPTGGRLTKDEAIKLSVQLWSTAGDLEREAHRIAQEKTWKEQRQRRVFGPKRR